MFGADMPDVRKDNYNLISRGDQGETILQSLAAKAENNSTFTYGGHRPKLELHIEQANLNLDAFRPLQSSRQQTNLFRSQLTYQCHPEMMVQLYYDTTII